MPQVVEAEFPRQILALQEAADAMLVVLHNMKL
jgi:hypothetical protein